tara:strand:+ start:1554 stop:1838 length:285 start_codon:yes stop_codon:yes gene_type:complete
MAENIIKKNKPKKDIGNLNNKDFGVTLDPNNDLCLSESGDRGQEAYYKGSKMSYLDYIGEVGARIDKNKKGKSLDNIGMFSGISFDKNGKIIKS